MVKILSLVVVSLVLGSPAVADPLRLQIVADRGAFVDGAWPTVSKSTAVRRCGESTRDTLARNVIPIQAIVVSDTIAIDVGAQDPVRADRWYDGRGATYSGKLYGFWDWSDDTTLAMVVDVKRAEVLVALMHHGTTASDRFEKACIERWRAPLRATQP